jgi:2-keto-3-deoxy-L-rhamnonate aldolase RhmA
MMNVCEGLLKKRIRNRELLIGGQILVSRTPAVVEAYQEAGFDFLLIDREHTALGMETISDLVCVARNVHLPCMVRAAEDCYHELNRTLDQGPDGIFVPRITGRPQVENILRTVKYNPQGRRGLCGSSAPISKYRGWGSLNEQIAAVNANTVVGIQIETAEALDALDDILSVAGVDVALVGNDDLTLGLGIPGDTENAEYVGHVDRVIEACRRYNVLPGIAVGDPETAVFWIKKGMKFLWYSTDIFLLYRAAMRELRDIRSRLS